MRVFTDKHDHDIVRLLSSGSVGILRTDTLYGIVARADDEQAVERIYKLKERNSTKSPIVLISSLEQLCDQPDEVAMQLIEQEWPGKVSIIMPSSRAPEWITRGNESVAYRLPADESLQQLLALTGPLIAPSANPEGEMPATTIEEAINYFGDNIDFYIDEGKVTDASPSQLLRINNDGVLEQLR